MIYNLYFSTSAILPAEIKAPGSRFICLKKSGLIIASLASSIAFLCLPSLGNLAANLIVFSQSPEAAIALNWSIFLIGFPMGLNIAK